jgi:hypothetical protein
MVDDLIYQGRSEEQGRALPPHFHISTLIVIPISTTLRGLQWLP